MYFEYLAEPGDLDELVEGVHKTRELVVQNAFDELRGAELVPGPQVGSDAEIRDWVRLATTTDFHPCGTCRMGHGPDAVVDDEMRVYGVEDLRVVDASVIPQIMSGNMNAPTQMIAARAADYITGAPQLAPEKVKFAFEQ